MNPDHSSRRKFLRNSATGSAIWMMRPFFIPGNDSSGVSLVLPESLSKLTGSYRMLNLHPASWVWYPGSRTLPNTVILFRKKFGIQKKVVSAKGWVIGESRYHLYVNENHIQFGPAPCDPRFTEADPVDLTGILVPGDNVIGLKVLFYGYGDGTWPIGKPGMIFRLDILYEDGTSEQVISDADWDCLVARSWKPGQYKRWYLRAFQEEFDFNLFPEKWNSPLFIPENPWNKAMKLDCRSDKPALCSTYNEYMHDIGSRQEECNIRERLIPSMIEEMVPASRLVEKKKIKWERPAEEYFEMVTPQAYRLAGELDINSIQDKQWTFGITHDESALLTFEFSEQIVGFPSFVIEAPKGTIVELMVQEGHIIDSGSPLMNNHFHSWSRFICREGKNEFRSFDYESLRWMQMLIRNCKGNLSISGVGVARRKFPWPNSPEIYCSDPALQKVFDASVNTLHNSAQETIVDGMGRERQQYSGDCGHQLHAIFFAFGESRLPARYLNTFSQGITHDGFFLDCWPAFDRLARVMERQLNLTSWGPILDHGIGFNFDCYNYYCYTGDLTALKEVFPRLIRFKNYLKRIFDDNTGLLPVDDLGIPSVWIDHDAYRNQQDKQCAFNLYATAMLSHAFLPLCKALEDQYNGSDAGLLAGKIRNGVLKNFWSESENTLVINKPRLDKDRTIRLCDRSLATAVMYDLIPEPGISRAIELLSDLPGEMGLSYPANAGWRYWALAKGGKMDVVINELKEKWAVLDSVILNNTLQEAWTVQADSGSQWSHCPVVPLYMLYMGILGIKPLSPGFGEIEIWPQVHLITSLRVKAHTVKGPIWFVSSGIKGERNISIRLPEGMKGRIKLDPREKTDLDPVDAVAGDYRLYKLNEGVEVNLHLKFT